MMGRSPCRHDEAALKKGPWTPEEDKILADYIEKHGLGSWSALPGKAGLNRCGKSCRLRWTNYLRPDIKRGRFSEEEERLIIQLHSHIGNKWSTMAARLPGRTDNEIKNYWNTHLKKKLLRAGVDPVTHRPRGADLALLANVLGVASLGFSGPSVWESSNAPPGGTQQLADSVQLARLQLLQTMVRDIVASAPSNSDLARAMASMLLRNCSSADSLFHGPKFQGLLDGTLGTIFQAAVPDSGVDLSSLAVGRINPQDLHDLGRPCDSLGSEGLLLPEYMSSMPEASTVDNSYGVEHHQVYPNSYNAATAASTSPPSILSASPEHAAVDHPQETMNSGLVSQDHLSTAELNSWSDYLSEAINDVPDWLDFLDDDLPPSWRRTE